MRRSLPAFILLVLTLPVCTLATPAAKNMMGPKDLSFIENKGQITARHYEDAKTVDLKLEAPGVNIFIGSGKLHYQWSASSSMQQAVADKTDQPFNKSTTQPMQTYRMDVELVGANKHAKLIKEEKQAYFENYFLPQCPNGATAHTFNKVTYKDIYPNIDWVLYSRNNELKYDFIVHPGGDPKDIKLKYKGATALNIKDGAVTAVTPMGSITEKKPYSYDAASKKEIPSAFVLNGDVLSFDIQKTNGTLVIDPVLIWGTYYGENGEDDWATCITADEEGNVYFGGHTRSSDEIASLGAFKMFPDGLFDAFVVKFEPDGSRKWGTYFGGMFDEEGLDMFFDTTANAIYFAGATNSPNIQIGSLTGHAGLRDAFLAKFNPDDGYPIWCSYYGGDADDNLKKMVRDPNGFVYLAGETKSQTLPATGFQQSSGGGSDAFLTKFNPGGQHVWSTYYGGFIDDIAHTLACDRSGNVYIAGETRSVNFFVTPGAFQDTFMGVGESFLVKFNSGGLLQYSTFCGDTARESISDIAFDPNVPDDMYMTIRYIYEFPPVPPNPPPPPVIVDSLFKWSASGVRKPWSMPFVHKKLSFDFESYLWAWGGIFDPTSAFPTPGAHQTTTGGGTDGFVLKMDTLGNKMYGTLYGGTYNDTVTDIHIDGRGRMYICGITNSPDKIATPSGHKPGWTGSFLYSDAFAAKFQDTILYLEYPFTDTFFCAPDTFNLDYFVQVDFKPGNKFTAQLSDANGSFTNPLNIGSLISTTDGGIQCAIPTNITAGSGYRVRIVSSSPAFISKDNLANIRIERTPYPTASVSKAVPCPFEAVQFNATSNVPGTSFQWIGPGGFNAMNANPVIASVTEANNGLYIVTASAHGCSAKDTVQLTVKPAPYVDSLGSNTPVCFGDSLRLFARSNDTLATYLWRGPNGFASNDQDPLIKNAAEIHTGPYFLQLRGPNGCYSDTSDLWMEVIKLEPIVWSDKLVYIGDTLHLFARSNKENTIFTWTGPNGYQSNMNDPYIVNVDSTWMGIYKVTLEKEGCTATGQVEVIVSNKLRFFLYPNANDGNFTVRGTVSEDQAVKMAIFNLSGKLLYTDEVMSFQRRFSRNISLPHLINGIYIIRMEIDGDTEDMKFVIMK